MTIWKAGMKCVCIDASSPYPKYPRLQYARVGPVYVVRAVQPGDFRGVSLLLEGIHNPIHPCGREYDFSASRFRPVVERKTDISVFTRLLSPSPAPVSPDLVEAS